MQGVQNPHLRGLLVGGDSLNLVDEQHRRPFEAAQAGVPRLPQLHADAEKVEAEGAERRGDAFAETAGQLFPDGGGEAAGGAKMVEFDIDAERAVALRVAPPCAQPVHQRGLAGPGNAGDEHRGSLPGGGSPLPMHPGDLLDAFGDEIDLMFPAGEELRQPSANPAGEPLQPLDVRFAGHVRLRPPSITSASYHAAPPSGIRHATSRPAYSPIHSS